jgi:uncharacterized repeat protein (TIGR01451 family)
VKTADATTYAPSSVMTFMVQVTNNGPSEAQAVEVRDDLPGRGRAEYISDTAGCQLQGDQLRCELGALGVGESKRIDVRMIASGTSGDVLNTARVGSATSDPTPTNNGALLTVTIQAGG